MNANLPVLNNITYKLYVVSTKRQTPAETVHLRILKVTDQQIRKWQRWLLILEWALWKYNIGHTCNLFTLHTHTHVADSSAHRISRQENWSGVPFSVLGDLPDPGIEPTSVASPALAGGFFTTSATWEVTCRRKNVLIVDKHTKKDLVTTAPDNQVTPILRNCV